MTRHRVIRTAVATRTRPMPIRTVIARLAAMVGYEAYPISMAEGRPLARRLKELFAGCAIRRVVDIGANRGPYRNFLRFDGGSLAFARVPPVQTELSFTPIYDAVPGWIQSIQAFEAAGFKVSDIFAQEQSRRRQLPLEADCLLLRPDAVPA